MLDALTTRDDEGRLSFTVYRKPTHTDQYLQFSSNQPLSHKLGVVRTLHHRCQTLCSSEELKLQELDHLRKVLSISGYTQGAWHTATAHRPSLTPRSTPSPQPAASGSITLPYVGHVSEAIARNIRKAGIQVHLRPTNTIRQKLVHPKDKLDKMEQAGVVYKIQCNDCQASYVGETERRLRTRILEHRRTSSPVGHHTDYNAHSVDTSSVSILHHESDWFRRGVAEAIHVQAESPTLNRGRERHTLPPIYQTILSCDNASSPQSHVTGSQC